MLLVCSSLFLCFISISSIFLLAFPLELTRAQSDLYLYLCDLLCGFLLQHSYQSHYFVLGNNLAPRIASLLYAREKHLRLGAFSLYLLIR
jgi:protein phosphatase-4 regulatory subunit 3